jgi:hypothetical protein
MAANSDPKQTDVAAAPAVGKVGASEHKSPSFWRQIGQSKEFGVFIALIILCVFMSLASPYFATSKNIFNVLQGMSTIAIVAIGETMVLVAGGLDLSVGAVLAVGAMVTARTMTYHGFHPWIAFGAGLLAGDLWNDHWSDYHQGQDQPVHYHTRHVEHRTRARLPAGHGFGRLGSQQRSDA